MRILLTGGTGFIGANFGAAAVRAGHEVLSFSRQAWTPTEARWLNVSAPISNPPWTKIAEFVPDMLVHTAWEATPQTYLDSPENRDWVRTSEDLVKGLSTLGVTRFMVLGSCIEYAITGQPLREDVTPLAPQFAYSQSKAELHQRLLRRFAQTANSLAWVRLFYPYGEHEHPQRLCSSLVRQFRQGERVTLRTPLSVKDYIHVDDVARGLVRIAESQYSGAINLGSGEGTTIQNLAQTIARLMGRTELLNPPDSSVSDPLFHVVADTSRLQRLGFFPQVPLEVGLRRLIDGRPS
ncbi:MAG TPA: NAD(P)-dependent oxidoreductase [Verrucomicrobiota bacterium]|nr:hypothetical protein [Verrucomicrobiales bacterium]HRI12254.1 NAD(P)-dependent oxidoreductase [Verrucomicrobiota bacterium]